MKWLWPLLLALAGPLHAAEAEAWLEKIAPALRQLDYQGTLVYVGGGRVESLRVFHRNRDGHERERLVALSGAVREVVRDGDSVLCVGADKSPVSYDVSQSGGWSPAVALAAAVGQAGYRLSVRGDDRIAGHAARVVDIRATDDWRYGYRVWLERGSGLPLRVDLLGTDGATIEQVAFTQLELGVPPSDADLAASVAGGQAVVLSGPRDPQAIRPDWQVPQPPPGFVLRATRQDGQGVQMLYSDGLASVSLYVEATGGGLHGGASSQRGAVHLRSFWLDGWHVLAIGKVPAATVDHFARTVRASRPDG